MAPTAGFWVGASTKVRISLLDEHGSATGTRSVHVCDAREIHWSKAVLHAMFLVVRVSEAQPVAITTAQAASASQPHA